jgi:Zn-dependent peptidase ImmA (M78 family)
MNNVNREFTLREQNTGGRGTAEIQSYVYSLLERYAMHKKSFTPPIDPMILAELRNVKIIYRQSSDDWVASLMPMGSGFVINVNESLPNVRIRNAICHEIAHTFFFDTSNKSPRRLGKPQPDDVEERLCFWAAREMLVPTAILKTEVEKLKSESLYTLDGISRLANIFVVSEDIIARRLSHDLSILENDWIILWYASPNKDENVKPRSLYPNHVSSSITNYVKSMIVDSVLKSVSECLENRTAVEREEHVGKRKVFQFKVRTEPIERHRIRAISWVSPFFKITVE